MTVTRIALNIPWQHFPEAYDEKEDRDESVNI